MEADLYAAASVGNLEAIMTLSHNINQVTEENHETVLHLAALSNVPSCVSAIIDVFHSHLLDKVNSKGQTALHLAASKGYNDVVTVLISKYKHFNLNDFITKGNNNLDTALHLAARSNHVDVVRLLVEADPGYKYTENNQSETPLYLAATVGNDEMIKTIFDNCPNASPDGPDGKTALHAAVISRKPVCIKVILQRRGDLFERADENGWTAFHHAASLKCEPELDWLIEHGNRRKRKAVMAMNNNAGKLTALHIAAHEGHTFIVLQLMEYFHHSIGTVDGSGRNILHIAAERNHKELFNSILHFRLHRHISKLFNVADTKNGNTPLHLLVLAGCYVPEFFNNELVKKDIKNLSGFTPVQLLYEDEKIIGDQLKIRKALKDIPQSDTTVQDSVVLKSKRRRKNAMFRVHERRGARKLKSYTKIMENQLVVTALIATVTFTVGFTMPGGYHDGDPGEADNGNAIHSKKNVFTACMIADATGLFCSVTCLLFYFISYFLRDPAQAVIFTTAFLALNIGSVVAMMTTFVLGTYVVLPKSAALPSVITGMSLCFFLALIAILSSLKLQLNRRNRMELEENWV